MPVGVVAVIAPWNFPLAIPIWKIAPALVYGNTVVFKPALEASATGARIVELFAEAGLPPGVLNFVVGRGSTIGDAIVEHKDVDAITFTGSNAIGSEIAKKQQLVGRNINLNSVEKSSYRFKRCKYRICGTTRCRRSDETNGATLYGNESRIC